MWRDGQALFTASFASTERHGKLVVEWTEMEVQSFLIGLITTRLSQLLTIFVDALDEGSNDDSRRVVSFLEHLT